MHAFVISSLLLLQTYLAFGAVLINNGNTNTAAGNLTDIGHVCVPAEPNYPAWAGSIKPEDCMTAWEQLKVVFSPTGGASIEWAFWFDEAAKPTSKYLRRTPVEWIHGTITISILPPRFFLITHPIWGGTRELPHLHHPYRTIR